MKKLGTSFVSDGPGCLAMSGQDAMEKEIDQKRKKFAVRTTVG